MRLVTLLLAALVVVSVTVTTEVTKAEAAPAAAEKATQGHASNARTTKAPGKREERTVPPDDESA